MRMDLDRVLIKKMKNALSPPLINIKYKKGTNPGHISAFPRAKLRNQTMNIAGNEIIGSAVNTSTECSHK